MKTIPVRFHEKITKLRYYSYLRQDFRLDLNRVHRRVFRDFLKLELDFTSERAYEILFVNEFGFLYNLAFFKVFVIPSSDE